MMSDHSGLRYLFDQDNLNVRQARWLATINEFEDPGSSFIHPGCDIYSGNIKAFSMYIIAADDHPIQRMIISAENYQSTFRRSSVICTKMYL